DRSREAPAGAAVIQGSSPGSSDAEEDGQQRNETADAGDEAALEVQPLSDATQIYLHHIGLNRLFTPVEELHHARLAAAGDFGARQKMIEHNLRLVVNVAKQYLNRGMPLLDLIEEGNLGLMHALDKFDPERGIMNQARTIRLPVHVIRELNTVLRARRHLSAHSEREPSVDDVAHLLGKDAGEVRDVL